MRDRARFAPALRGPPRRAKLRVPQILNLLQCRARLGQARSALRRGPPRRAKLRVPSAAASRGAVRRAGAGRWAWIPGWPSPTRLPSEAICRRPTTSSRHMSEPTWKCKIPGPLLCRSHESLRSVAPTKKPLSLGFSEITKTIHTNFANNHLGAHHFAYEHCTVCTNIASPGRLARALNCSDEKIKT